LRLPVTISILVIFYRISLAGGQASPGAHRWIMSIIAVSTIAAMVAMTVTRIE
jgi:hypothetical protein